MCASTGFENTAYFSKLFRKKNGMTPKEYRSLHR
ncbi:MAG: AraC family transcriptional regulator [Firmicutes bacterium]|nr:AraC family transcriptional regulator [Bacillota bacterium]